MTNTAELALPMEASPESAHALSASEPLLTPATTIPSIEPKMAGLLELSRSNDSSLTPKEINAQLDGVLRDYDELTALYAANNRRIDSALAELQQSGGVVSSQVHRLGAELQQQSRSLTAHAAATEERIDGLRDEARIWMADAEQRWEARLVSNSERIHAEVARLDVGIGSLADQFKVQDHLIAEQRARLDQFAITYQLLDTATRGNKSRIEAVREQAEKQQALIETRIEGLSALQREHYAEFATLQGLVGVLRSESQRLDAAIADLATALAEHRSKTHDKFKWTHLAIAGLLLLTLLGFALVKWVPAFAPVGSESAIASNAARIGEIDAQVAALSAGEAGRQESDARRQARIDEVSGKVSSLEQSLGELRAAVSKMRGRAPGTGVVYGREWLLQQNPKAYTVQLVESPSQADMSRFINRNLAQMPQGSLAFSASTRDQRERYSLYFGAFATIRQARAAMAALPAELQVNRPWVRQFHSVQDSLR